MPRFNYAGNPGYAQSKYVSRGRRRNKRAMRRTYRFKKRVEKAVEDQMLEKSNYHVTQVQRIPTASGAAGSQYFANVLGQNSATDITAIFGQIGTSVAGNPALTSKAMKFNITGYQANIIMKSQTNFSQIVDLYFVVPRFDTANLPATCFYGGFADQNNSTASNLWGVTPYMNNLFCVTYKIISKKRVVLAGGATELIEYKDGKNYQIEYERLYSNSSNLAYKGKTKYVFAIVRGEPVGDESTLTDISTEAPAVNFVTSETYYYTYTVLNNTVTNTANNFHSITTPITLNVQSGTSVSPVDV